MHDDSMTERLRWAFREALAIALILLVWRGIAIIGSMGIGNIGMGNNVFTVLGSHIATLATQAGIASVVLYILVRAGTYIVNYYETA